MGHEYKKVCILGAAGSIGSRLVSLLHEQGYQITAVVRSLSSAVRIGRYNIDVVNLDLLSEPSTELVRILKGHDVVIDCTYSAETDYDKRLAQAQLLAQTVVDAMLKASVKRLIHYGTISVYPTIFPVVDETVECTNKGDSYADSKLKAEQYFLSKHSSELCVTVLQLPIVFGPFMGWSKFPVSQMKNQELLIPNDLKGVCSPLFVDDVVRATVLAFGCKAVFGERVLLSDKSMSWGEYFSSYSGLSASLNFKSISRDEFIELRQKQSHSAKPFQRLKKCFMDDGDFRQLVLAQWGVRTVYRFIKKSRGQSGIDEIKQKISGAAQVNNNALEKTLLNDESVNLFDSLPEVDSSKAKKLLGMHPYTEFSSAITTTQSWLKWARLIN